jgi:hypothetical protein
VLAALTRQAQSVGGLVNLPQMDGVHDTEHQDPGSQDDHAPARTTQYHACVGMKVEKEEQAQRDGSEDGHDDGNRARAHPDAGADEQPDETHQQQQSDLATPVVLGHGGLQQIAMEVDGHQSVVDDHHPVVERHEAQR